MILTDRDRELVFDLTLSHALTRDQVIQLGFFESISRANSRLKSLREAGFVRRLTTPYFSQTIYAPGRLAIEIVDSHAASLIAKRAESPRFLQHALAVTNTRISLKKRGATLWRFEPQLRTSFQDGLNSTEVRPDGLAISSKSAIAVEVDMGHVCLTKLSKKLASYAAFRRSTALLESWQINDFNLLFVTIGRKRRGQIQRLCRQVNGVNCLVQTFEELQIETVGGWS